MNNEEIKKHAQVVTTLKNVKQVLTKDKVFIVFFSNSFPLHDNVWEFKDVYCSRETEFINGNDILNINTLDYRKQMVNPTTQQLIKSFNLNF